MIERSLPFVFLLLSLIINNVASSNLFCSAYCAPNACTGIANGQCTGCLSPFILNTSTSTCDLDPSTRTIYIAESSAFTYSPLSTSNCASYNINGPFTSSTSSATPLTLTFAGPVPITHNYLRFIAWFVLYDEWKTNSDYIEVQLDSPLSVYQQNLTGYPTQ